MTIFTHIALLDSDSRLLLHRAGDNDGWCMPFCPADEAVADTLVSYLLREWAVQTFAKALFPLAFASPHNDVDLVYGCRNWVGSNGLQHIARENTMWIKPARLYDDTISPRCRELAPTMLTLLGGG